MKNLEECIEIIDSVLAEYKSLQKFENQLEKAIPMSGCIEPLWKLFDKTVCFASELMEDTMARHDSWLSWYIYDNNCGKNKLEASIEGAFKEKPIETTKDLAQLIIESRKT